MKYFKNGLLIMLVLAGTLIIASCSSAPEVTRTSSETVTDLSGDWNDTDSRLVSETMIRDMAARPWIADFKMENGKKPVLIVGNIRNQSSEHINTGTFVKDIERELINSGKVKFVASSQERSEIRQERLEQQNYASEATVKELANETGADFILKGSIKTHIDAIKGQKVKFYQVDLEVINVESNEKVWIGTKKIKKEIDKRSLKW